MTPFNTALNVAGGMRQSSPKAIILKPQVQPKVVPQMATLPPRQKSSMVTKQVSDYGKAMNQAIKNTNSY